MKKTFNFLIFIAVISASFFVNAAQWQSVGSGQAGEFFVDQTSASGPSTARIMSVKRNVSEGQDAPASMALKYQINCTTNEFILISAKIYSDINFQGAEKQGTFPNLNKIQNAAPNTLGAKYVNAACSNQSTSAQATVKPTVSSDTNNFLIGLCDTSSVPKGDPRVTSCQVSALEARPVWSTGVNIYGANSMTNLLVWGRKNRESNYGGQQNQNNQSNVTYKIESPENIIVTIATPNGCSISEKFTKSGSDIFHQTVSYSGRCQEGQARAIQEEIKSGKTKVEYLRVN
jgi:hypothetical protein